MARERRITWKQLGNRPFTTMTSLRTRVVKSVIKIFIIFT